MTVILRKDIIQQSGDLQTGHQDIVKEWFGEFQCLSERTWN